MRFSASAWSTAWIERSRLTYSGTIMNGKITMSRSGSTGSTSGILGWLALLSWALRSFLVLPARTG